ncbi:hypothetical protein ACO0LB_18000 [Undibacterium sp. SXout7W]|uniref:hypothetical protein n=1 Tax=Undibacterium sp. SXout7W TaxID=3413049 RepID=UPI003BF3FEA9
MPHHFLEGFENKWTLVRETSSSQKFRVKTPDDHTFALDIHYTIGKMLTVNVVFMGKKENLSKNIINPVLDELGRIAIKHRDYAVIDYTLACTDELFDGNFTIDEKDRLIRKL